MPLVTAIHEDGGRCEITNGQFVFPFHEAVLKAHPAGECFIICPVCGKRFRNWFVPPPVGEFFEISPSESGAGSVQITTTLTHALDIPPGRSCLPTITTTPSSGRSPKGPGSS